jgi:hypothetical protein
LVFIGVYGIAAFDAVPTDYPGAQKSVTHACRKHTASKVRNIGAIEGNQPAKDNDWESIVRGKDPAIEKWIKDQMKGRTCTVVLIGQETARRKWIDYEIIESWKQGLGVVGVHIHNLTNQNDQQSGKGANPFSHLTLGDKNFGNVVKTYDPPYSTSSTVYYYIAANLETWIDEAVRIRNAY